MSGLVLTLRTPPPAGERIDLAGLTSALMATGASSAVAGLVVGTTRERVRLGDVFALRTRLADDTVIETGDTPVDGIATGLTAGRVLVEGDAGAFAGHGMRGGRLEIRGRAGDHVGAGLAGGVVHVAGDVGAGAGGLVPGRRFGMTGGTIVVEGDAGARLGEKMRRGLIVVRGATGPSTGARMLGGTVVVEGRLGPDPGRLMRRGTILAPPGTGVPAGAFADCGVHDLVILHVMARAYARDLADLGPRALPARVRRYAGDLATIGHGEILVPA
jgi:formylmethanofuran dehydrogenase subunit C